MSPPPVDPWLPDRLRASTLVIKAERQVEQAVRDALEEWLTTVRRLVLGDTLTAAGQAPDLGGFAASEPDWVAAILKFVMPALAELFGERFLTFARVATISDQPYREAYIAEVSSRLKLFPAEQFEEIRPEIQEAISEGESIDQVRDRVAAILDFDAAADAPGTADHDRTKRLRARINEVEKLLDDPGISVDAAVALRAERRELYDDLHASEKRWLWKARRIARTELIGGLNSGSYQGAVARAEILDLTLYKQWLATDDLRTRQDHREADGQIVRLTSPFNVCGFPMMYPGMPGGPAACVIQCRCTFLVLDEDELTPEQLAAINEGDPETPAVLDEQGGTQSTDTITAGGDTMPDQTDQLPSGWRGVLAALDVPTGDRRILATPPDGVRTREGTLFIAWQREGGHGHDGAVLAGRIDRVWTDTLPDGKNVLMGEGPFDLGGEDGAEAARLVHEGFLSGVSIDPDDVTMEWWFCDRDGRRVDVDDMDEDELWDAYEAGDIVELMVMTDWRLSGATLTTFPAFDEARIEPLYGYVSPDVAMGMGVTGATDLPVAERDHAWSGQDAKTRVFDAYTNADGDVDTEAVARAFLWRDPDAAGDAKGSYKLGYADISDGELRIIPAGVAATAGGRGVDAADIPDDAKTQIRSRICSLYSTVRGVYEDWPDCPFDDSMQAAGPPQPRVYAAADFADPALTGYTPLQVTADGRVYGHLASWRQPDGSPTCHTSYPDACVTPPRSAANYGYFHLGEVATDSGPLPVGKLTLGGGHADPKVGYRGAVEHYDDTGTAVAVVRAGEDEHGIWVAGRLLDTVTPDQVETLMRSPLSGDWRRIGGTLELVAALCVNVPGFPVPRVVAASGESGLQVSLIATGAPPALRRRNTTRRKPGAEPVDYQRLAAAVVREMRDTDARQQRSDQLARRIGRDNHSRALAAAARIQGGQ